MSRIGDGASVLFLVAAAAVVLAAAMALAAARDVEAMLLVAFAASLLWSSWALVRGRES